MNNWMQRLAIFAVLGAVLSTAVLTGCGGSSDDGGDATGTPTAAAAGKDGGDE